MNSQDIHKKKSSIHPKYRDIEVILTDGTKVSVMSTYEKDSLALEIDPSTHIAWTKDRNKTEFKDGEVQKFNKKFGTLFTKK